MINSNMNINEKYQQVIKRFLSKIDKSHSMPTAQEFIDALLDDGKPKAKVTWRLYKAAIKAYYEANDDLENRTQFIELCDQIDFPVAQKQSLIKTVSPLIVETITTYLHNQNTINSVKAAAIFNATIITGLRPIEWTNAILIDDRLVVKNAKYKHLLRANGETRELILHLDDLEIHDLKYIQSTLKYLHNKSWQKDCRNIRRAFKSAVRALSREGLIPTRYKKLRIYDARHQFSANAKNTMDLLSGEVAAAMGHIVVDTAIEHYGRKRNAHSASKVRPSKKSIEAVNTKKFIAPNRTPSKNINAIKPNKPKPPSIS